LLKINSVGLKIAGMLQNNELRKRLVKLYAFVIHKGTRRMEREIIPFPEFLRYFLTVTADLHTKACMV